jgi:hypothetical protein
MAKRELLLECDVDVRLHAILLQQLDAQVEEVDTVVPLNFVLLSRTAPLEYDYKIRALDGRKWNQHFVFDGPADTDPAMTFDTLGDLWRRTEFTVARPLRDTLVSLVITLGVESLRVNFQ